MKNLIFATQFAAPKRNSINPVRIKRICSCSWKISFKKTDFQGTFFLETVNIHIIKNNLILNLLFLSLIK